MKKFVAVGTLTVDFGVIAEGLDQQEVFERLCSLFAAHNIGIKMNYANESDNQSHKLNIQNLNIEWDHLEEIDESDYKKGKDQATE